MTHNSKTESCLLIHRYCNLRSSSSQKKVIAVKHNHRIEQWEFLLALLLKDLLVKERRRNELVFTDNFMHILGLDNSDTDDKNNNTLDGSESKYSVKDDRCIRDIRLQH